MDKHVHREASLLNHARSISNTLDLYPVFRILIRNKTKVGPCFDFFWRSNPDPNSTRNRIETLRVVPLLDCTVVIRISEFNILQQQDDTNGPQGAGGPLNQIYFLNVCVCCCVNWLWMIYLPTARQMLPKKFKVNLNFIHFVSFFNLQT